LKKLNSKEKDVQDIKYEPVFQYGSAYFLEKVMNEIWNKKGLMKLGWIIIFIVMSLSSCLYDREFAHFNDQIIILNERVTKLQESLDTKMSSSDLESDLESRSQSINKDLESGLQSIHTSQADVGVEVDQIKRTIVELSGRVEENEHIIKRAVERDLSERDAMKAELAQLFEKVKALEEIVQRQQERLKLEPLAAPKEPEKEATDQKETDQQHAEVVEQPKSKELELYDNSLASFREEEFQQAMDGFQQFLKEYPKSDRADNAQFWIGECFMAQKEYEKAILAYQEVIKNYPKGNKVPIAMLRQAIAWFEIKEEKAGIIILKNLIKKYPDSDEAKIAKAKLTKIE
jgi:tol-pal system protein YbgF